MNKRIVTLLLVLMMLLTACGHKTPTGETDPNTGDPPATEETQPQKDPAADDQETPDKQEPAPAPSEDASSSDKKPDKDAQSDNKPSKKPDEPSDDKDDPAPPASGDALTYEEYNAMSGEEQETYFNSFDSTDDFFDWYNQAKADYEAQQDDIIIGEDTHIDLGKLTQ